MCDDNKVYRNNSSEDERAIHLPISEIASSVNSHITDMCRNRHVFVMPDFEDIVKHIISDTFHNREPLLWYGVFAKIEYKDELVLKYNIEGVRCVWTYVISKMELTYEIVKVGYFDWCESHNVSPNPKFEFI